MQNNRKEIFEGWDLLARLRNEKPLIHCITNYVTANDVANIVLAAGASPVMADDLHEVEEITALSKALVLNLGTLKITSVESMVLAGKKAVSLGNPVILDPVGAGASKFRTEAAQNIVKEIPCTVIRGNASEIRAIAGIASNSQGVDADIRDQVKESDHTYIEELLKTLSRNTGAVIVMTGAVDMIADENHICKVKNGHNMMAGITGTGCMMDGVLASFQATSQAASPENGNENEQNIKPVFLRCIYAAAASGICGEMAYQKAAATEGGTGSFRMYYIDAMSKLTDEDIQGGIKIEI